MDKRLEPRIAHEVKFFVHIKECKANAELIGLSVECVAIDLSTRGMQFKTDIELYSGTELGITIGIGHPFAMYELYGSVRWVKVENDEYFMGVLLEERDNTDYDKWESDFTRLFKAS